jgi:hypothetical protein
MKGRRYVEQSALLKYDNDNDKPIKTLLKGKGLLPPVGLARLDSQGELLPMSCELWNILQK